MGVIPRPYALAILAFAAIVSACAPKMDDVTEIDAGYALCQIGCRAYTVQLRRNGTYVVNDVLQGKVRGGILLDAFSNLPLNEISRCAKPSLTQMDDIYLSVQLRDHTRRTCQITASGTWRGTSPEIRVRQFVALNLNGVYFEALLPRRTAIHAALRDNTLTSVEFTRTGCLGDCPSYDVVFSSDGNATFSERGCPKRSGLVPFDRVRTALWESNAALLAPSYPHNAVDTPGASIALSIGRRVITSEGRDAASWGPEFTHALERLDQVVADSTWNPPLSSIAVIRPSRLGKVRNACQRSPWVIVGDP